MGLSNAKDGKWIYHLTELKNLESIIKYGLLSRAVLIEKGLLFEDVADPNIIDERKPLGLNNYIPFHFHPYSAFDVAVKAKYSADELIYICVERDYAKRHGFKILPFHPLYDKKGFTLYEYREGFDKINWEVMTKVGYEAENAKNIKMAECLSEKAVPFSDFQSIHVSNQECRNKVINILNGSEMFYNPPFIDIQPKWFT